MIAQTQAIRKCVNSGVSSHQPIVLPVDIRDARHRALTHIITNIAQIKTNMIVESVWFQLYEDLYIKS